MQLTIILLTLSFQIQGEKLGPEKINFYPENAFLNADLPFFDFPEIKGVVQSERGEPLIGATIRIKRGKVLSITDKEGKFAIRKIKINTILEISYIGFSSQEILITDDRTCLEIVLKESKSKLDEVQVIPYEAATQRNNEGSLSQITADQIESQPINNPLEALEARVPGLAVNKSNEHPGSAGPIEIRANSPGADHYLYIVDGVLYEPENEKVSESKTPTARALNSPSDLSEWVNPLNHILMADIYNFEILSGAEAIATYGQRGINGVVLITTKMGKARMKLNAESLTKDLMPAMPFVISGKAARSRPAFHRKVCNTVHEHQSHREDIDKPVTTKPTEEVQQMHQIKDLPFYVLLVLFLFSLMPRFTQKKAHIQLLEFALSLVTFLLNFASLLLQIFNALLSKIRKKMK